MFVKENLKHMDQSTIREIARSIRKELGEKNYAIIDENIGQLRTELCRQTNDLQGPNSFNTTTTVQYISLYFLKYLQKSQEDSDTKTEFMDKILNNILPCFFRGDYNVNTYNIEKLSEKISPAKPSIFSLAFFMGNNDAHKAQTDLVQSVLWLLTAYYESFGVLTLQVGDSAKTDVDCIIQ